jgi:Flp pilus assembly protein TadG
VTGRAARSPERGSAAVDFALVGALLTALFVGVLQLGLTLHVRTTLIDCAAEGARFGALAGSSPGAGVQRTRDLIAGALSPAYAEDVAAGLRTLEGASVLEVTVRAPLPVIGLLGPSGVIAVSGRAVAET